MKLIVATNNKGKLEEFKDSLSGLDIELLSISDIDKNINIEENGSTYEENALIKARALCKLTNEICLGDDSGLEIEAMKGELGVYTARFMGSDTPHSEKIDEVLRRMKGLPLEERRATFRCVLALCYPDGREKLFEGRKEGYISEEPLGTGFGFDPIFYLPDYNKTYGEIGMQEKNKISHRGIALTQFKEHLLENSK